MSCYFNDENERRVEQFMQLERSFFFPEELSGFLRPAGPLPGSDVAYLTLTIITSCGVLA